MPEIQVKKLFHLAETFFLIAEVVEKAPLYFFENFIFEKLLYIGSREKIRGLYE
jgi:hypothetical protein